MRSVKDKNIRNQQVDYNRERLSNLTSNNDNGDFNKQKNLKAWVGIFKNIDENFPGGNFLDGNFPGGVHQGGV